MIYGVLNPAKILYQQFVAYICPPYLYTVGTLSWEIQKSSLQQTETSNCLRYLIRKQTGHFAYFLWLCWPDIIVATHHNRFYRAAWNATRSYDEISVRLSVRLSVCLSVKRVHCDKTEESYV